MNVQDRAAAGALALSLLDNLIEGCQLIGYDFRYLYLNKAAAAQARLPVDQLMGRTMAECFPGIQDTAMFGTLQRCMTERVPLTMENEFTYPDGSSGVYELAFRPVPEGVCVLSVDRTDRHSAQAALTRMQNQMLRIQKLEAVGRLASSLAHDFNNMLAVVQTCTELATEQLSADDPARADLSEVTAVVRRATGLTAQLLAFSRKQAINPRLINLNESVDSLRNILQRALGHGVELRIVPGEGLDWISVDPGQLDQVLMNLTVNARDAMPDGGTLTIETANAVIDEEFAREQINVTPGPYVALVVRDTGVGMDEEVKSRLFEPFFTTKPDGKGTGLGLATTFGIVQKHGGFIWVASQPGGGTTFRLYFPRAGEISACGKAAPVR